MRTSENWRSAKLVAGSLPESACKRPVLDLDGPNVPCQAATGRDDSSSDPLEDRSAVNVLGRAGVLPVPAQQPAGHRQDGESEPLQPAGSRQSAAGARPATRSTAANATVCSG